jgi:hypothetical protein
VINDRKTQSDLSKSKKNGSSFLKEAELAIVISADSSISDVWTEDASIASTIVLLTAENLSLGACWIQIRNRIHDDKSSSEDYVKHILKKVEYILMIQHILIKSLKMSGIIISAVIRCLISG